MPDSFWPHESQHVRPPCPSPSPGVHSDTHSSSQWCHPAISSSVVPFSSCPQSLPASQSFPMSKLFPWGGQSTAVSALASFLPKKSQAWSPSEWTGWISLQSKGLSRVFSNTTVQKHQFFGTQPSSQPNSHPYMTTGKTIALTRRTFVGKVISLLLNDLAVLPQYSIDYNSQKDTTTRSVNKTNNISRYICSKIELFISSSKKRVTSVDQHFSNLWHVYTTAWFLPQSGNICWVNLKFFCKPDYFFF